MNGTLSDRRGGLRFMIALLAVMVAATVAVTINNHAASPPEAMIIVLIGLAVFGLQLRHSLAAADGARPCGWRWTLLALIVLAYAPFWWLGSDWLTAQWYPAASGAMLLRGWRGAVAAAAPIVVWVAPYPPRSVLTGTSPGQQLGYELYELTIAVIGVGVLYWSARLVRVIAELSAARTELAEVAVEAERRRISRDLHDLLGQSLSAVSLKGDLAIRLLRTDSAAALAEVADLTQVARGALRTVRTVAHSEQRLSLRGETDAAVALLEAAGIATRVEAAPSGLPDAVEDLFAWAVREGTTNMLRHSDARNCWMSVGHEDGAARLTIVNDGARAPAGEGTGLRGLADRARALSGSVIAGRIAGGRFRLAVEASPEVPAVPAAEA